MSLSPERGTQNRAVVRYYISTSYRNQSARWGVEPIKYIVMTFPHQAALQSVITSVGLTRAPDSTICGPTLQWPGPRDTWQWRALSRHHLVTAATVSVHHNTAATQPHKVQSLTQEVDPWTCTLNIDRSIILPSHVFDFIKPLWRTADII